MKYSVISVLFALFSTVCALHLDMVAQTIPEQVCIRDFVMQGQLVIVSVTSDGQVNDGQILSLDVFDRMGNQYREKKDFAGNIRVTFTPSYTTSFDICLKNEAQIAGRSLSRQVEVDIEIGSEARDWSRIQTAEKLKPVEVELRKIEELTDEIADEFNYLKSREERLRDTNESTNRRVRNFSALVIFVFISLGVWQINYLKKYFRAKHII
ncbi:Erv25p Ecym_4075 [Eremothecium cymbalariae DBVPG|uniref:GOLD domain-containing protein n=1 Tax=Eremothecium cymbalariae (strain CBS 270.75 / DBVPG 7215 / KCTC 17166 / NRRL Y-17582) TaxID=931890 RepID=G8JT02_ERECY|nr:hypothetical protein Ecym_4075 [Eremothecium cymbalariae DBVPG\